jgi:hypothetical protein
MSNYAVDRDRWGKMTIFEQMGNIYSEVGRSFNAKRTGDSYKTYMATSRAIDLFDATVEELVKMKSVKSREVIIAKNEYLKTISDRDFDDKNVRSLENYFLEFAIVARKNT